MAAFETSPGDIPPSLRWLVTPVVNRLSLNSLTTTLRQTREAVHSLPWLSACSLRAPLAPVYWLHAGLPWGARIRPASLALGTLRALTRRLVRCLTAIAIVAAFFADSAIAV